MTLFRRFLVFQAFLLWQGGFVFYAAVVVPVGTTALGSELAQGLVTQRVTDWLNRIGLAWHAVMAWDTLADRDPSRRRAWARLILWAASLVLLAGLLAVHMKLDELLADGTILKGNRPAFRGWHITYLWISTGQWAVAAANAWLTLAAWTRKESPPLVGGGR